MASTTSTEQSGLFAHLLPAFKKATGIDVRVVALGTGQALDMGRRGDADVLFVHDQVAEEKFVADGFGLKRSPVMYNDFVLDRPEVRPGRRQGQRHRRRPWSKLAAGSAEFISRGDKSGTHAAELRYWKAAGIDAPAGKVPGYKECGCGMGPALNIAASTNAYVLADRGTWLSFKNRADLAVAGRRRQAPVQPVRRDRRQPGQAPAREAGPGAGLRRLGGVAGGAGRRSPATRSAASSCSSRTPGSREAVRHAQPLAYAGFTIGVSPVLCPAPIALGQCIAAAPAARHGTEPLEETQT